MTMTTRVQSVSIPVADQDRALAFYTQVLGCELRTDIEVWPGARLVEGVPSGSSAGMVLLPPDSEIPWPYGWARPTPRSPTSGFARRARSFTTTRSCIS